MKRQIHLATLVLSMLTLSVSIPADAASPPKNVDIVWTETGIPHITAQDQFGLGEGVGYAYAKDNLCLLEDEILTVNAQRSRSFGADGRNSAGMENLQSDLFFSWLNTDAAVEAFWQAQPEVIQQRIDGYVQGFNRYLAESKPEACDTAAWLRPISRDDLVKLVRRLMVEGGIGQFSGAMLAAHPGQSVNSRFGMNTSDFAEQQRNFAQLHGSNAIAIGSERSDNGRGMLLANPHFPWDGAMRFYQLHLRIPGEEDVMGAALPGLPVVNIGFNRNMAWTHTVDTSSHFTLHRLELVPGRPTHYRIDGQEYVMKERQLEVDSKQADGSLQSVKQTVYETIYGPVVVWPGVLEWGTDTAYALQDANIDNTRALYQWFRVNRANSVAELKEAIDEVQGIPWVNTLAADSSGSVVYLNRSVVPNVSMSSLVDCVDVSLQAKGLPGLDGSRSKCNWQVDDEAVQAGTVAPSRQPALIRRDFVQNSNDSAWMTNPRVPLTQFSPLISRSGTPLNYRTRYLLSKIAGSGATLTEAELKKLVTDNDVYSADLVLDDILSYCREEQPALFEEGRICESLSHWKRDSNIDAGKGVLYFQVFMGKLTSLGDSAWKVKFDASSPLDTPRGVDWENPEISESLGKILNATEREINALGLPEQVRWGDVQFVTRNGDHIAIPGGNGRLGIYNAITAVTDDSGTMQPVSGSSYIQLVGFNDEGPYAQGLLTFSQSTDPDSPNYSDQTRLFSSQKWQRLPFTQVQIESSEVTERVSFKGDR